MSEPSSESTVVEAIASLRALGFDADFSVTAEGRVACGECNSLHEPSEMSVERTVRIEGISNPDDEAAVFGLRCSHCGVRGVLVTAYGPTASAEEAEVVTALSR